MVLSAGEDCKKTMPGENCAVFGCGTCRKVKGIGIWKVPAAKDVSTQEMESGLA